MPLSSGPCSTKSRGRSSRSLPTGLTTRTMSTMRWPHAIPRPRWSYRRGPRPCSALAPTPTRPSGTSISGSSLSGGA